MTTLRFLVNSFSREGDHGENMFEQAGDLDNHRRGKSTGGEPEVDGEFIILSADLEMFV